MSYEWIAGAFRCTKVKDRNGNYLTLAYNDYGYLATATDTLGRVVTVNYDSQYYPTSITQTWKTNNGEGSGTSTHPWATFTYTTLEIQTDFDGVTVVGPPNGTYIKVLEKVIYPDTSWTKFLYNGYGQVKKVENYAADYRLLNYTRTNLDSVAADQTDCPRFTLTAMKAENFNLSGGAGTEQEVVVTNTAPTSDSTTLPGSLSVSGKSVDVAVTGHPDSLYSRTYYADSGWQEGLPLATQDCTGTDCATVKRWTWAQWQQDQVGLTEHPYQRNPRVIETRVGDGTNTKRTTISHLRPAEQPMNTDISMYGLPELVQVYAADLSTVIKKSEIAYNLTSTYTDRRILGLPAETKAWGWNDLTSSLEYVSRTTFEYDYDDDFAVSGMNQNISPVQHDATNYGASFSAGRGNMTKAIRWDVTDDDDPYDAVETKTLYNTAGSVVARITPWDGTNTRTVKIAYEEDYMFNDGITTRNTHAYPTKIYDPAGNYSSVKYRYDIGANVEATSPAPAGQTYGKTTKRVFDSLGRLQKNSVYVNTTEQAYTRYEYPETGVHSKVFSTLVDTNSNGPDSNDEVLSESWHDGAGRVLRSRVPHTFSSGTPATWAGTLTEYDLLGRVTRQSVPTEVDGSFAATGDDSTRGFIWNQQEYDWMGRTTRTIPTDSNGSDGKDTLISYAGCGCAGGLETTVQGPLVPRDDDPQTNARRMQKSWADILGRTKMTQTFDWDEDPYLTTEIKFNGRDQTIKVEQTDEEATVTQTSTATFDGHGRLYQSHRPEQRDNSNNLKYTTYSYNPDDSILSMTDGRGVITTYTHNSRGLATNIAWNVGSTGVTDTDDVELTYDNLGNRTLMTDGMGSVSYEYNSLSQLTAEKRIFSDTLSEAPLVNSVPAYLLTYEYEIGGQLKSYTDPYGEEIDYSLQKSGRLNAITGSSFGGVTTYAEDAAYRAWGALKYLEKGINKTEVTYNNRLQASSMLVNQIANPSTKTYDKDYEYYADGSLKKVDETASSLLNKFDRLFTYNHQGRVKEAKSGTEAHGTTETDLTLLPYRQNYTFNAFGNITGRDSTLWDYTNGNWDFEYTVANNRVSSMGYDNDGRQTLDPRADDDNDPVSFIFDARGSMIETSRYYEAYETEMAHDGDGRELKRASRVEDPAEEGEWLEWQTAYFIRSSVLGKIVSETTATGGKRSTYVYGAGALVAQQNVTGGSTESVSWRYMDASGLSSRGAGKSKELDALGNNVGAAPNLSPPARPENSYTPAEGATFDDMTWGDCEVNGVFMPCSTAQLVTDGQSYLSSNPGLPVQVGSRAATTRSASGQSLLSGRSVVQIELPDIWDESTATLYVGGYSLEYIGGDAAGGEVSTDEPTSLPCPEPSREHSFPAKNALDHYMEGTGNPVHIPIDDINAPFSLPSQFPAIRDLVKKGTGKKSSVTHKIEAVHSGPVQTNGWQAAVLGRITFDLTGTLKVYEWGLVEFEGTIGVIPDRYDFDAGDRTIVNQASTIVGSAIPGKPYDIITGWRFDVTQSWNRYKTFKATCKK